MPYIYETHLHTIEGSACSDTPGKDYIEHMKSIGYSGIIVTDHFFNGNCAVPRELPWKKKVELYCAGYEHALKEAEGTGFTVLFGVEFNFQGDEYLIYGIDKKWLLDHPEIMDMTRKELHEFVNASGGIMLQAHPYRERGYLKTIHLAPNDVDGCEVFNAENPDDQNARGYQYALENHLLMSAGSDIHHLNQKHMGGMSFPYPIETIQDFVKAFLADEGTAVYKRDVDAPDATFLPVSDCSDFTQTDLQATLPVVVH